MELRWIYDRRDVEEARRDLAAWLGKWAARYPKLCAWVEENIDETLSFYRLPRQHHKHLKSTQALSPQQYQELTNYALRYHVQLIPYLDAPAHIAFLLKHPSLARL